MAILLIVCHDSSLLYSCKVGHLFCLWWHWHHKRRNVLLMWRKHLALCILCLVSLLCNHMELFDFRMMGLVCNCFSSPAINLLSMSRNERFSCAHNLKNVWISERLQEGKPHTLLHLWKIQVRSVTEALLLIGARAARVAYCLHCWICWKVLECSCW